MRILWVSSTLHIQHACAEQPSFWYGQTDRARVASPPISQPMLYYVMAW